jgi:hypothetical protein
VQLRALKLSWVILLVAFGFGAVRAEKPEKLRVALGSWTGPHAGSFKSALRSGMRKECLFVNAKTARAIIDGEVVEQGKRFSVRVIVKSAKTGEVAEQREFSFAGPSPSQHQSSKMGHDVAEMVRRAPAE